MHEKYFGYARNRARKHDKIFFVISNPVLDFCILNWKKISTKIQITEGAKLANILRGIWIVDSPVEPNKIQIGDFESDSTDSSDIPSYEIRPDLLEKSQAFSETLRRKSIPKRDSMDTEVCFEAYEELDEIKNEDVSDKLEVRLCNFGR